MKEEIKFRVMKFDSRHYVVRSWGDVSFVFRVKNENGYTWRILDHQGDIVKRDFPSHFEAIKYLEIPF